MGQLVSIGPTSHLSRFSAFGKALQQDLEAVLKPAAAGPSQPAAQDLQPAARPKPGLPPPECKPVGNPPPALSELGTLKALVRAGRGDAGRPATHEKEPLHTSTKLYIKRG